MLEHVFKDAGVDVDLLATELVRWFRRRGFETQDFSASPRAVVVQARKANWLRTVSGMNLALTVHLRPRRQDLQVEIGAGEWTDKAIGGALALFVPWAWPIAFSTGLGLFKQSQLPQEVLDYIETHVDARQRRAERRLRPEYGGPRRSREEWIEDEVPPRPQDRENFWLEQERAELEAFDARLRAAQGETDPPPVNEPSKSRKEVKTEAGFPPLATEAADREISRPPQGLDTCPECNASCEPEDRFCMQCGARLE